MFSILVGDEADRILRLHSIFAIDWFTDNKREAPLRVLPSKERQGINGLVDDQSFLESNSGGKIQYSFLF